MKEMTVIKVEAFTKAAFIDHLASQLVQKREAIHNRR